MPIRLRDFRCPVCGMEEEHLVGGHGPDWRPPYCAGCHRIMIQVPGVPRVNINMGPVPIVGYYDDTLGAYVRTNEHRRRLMREQGVTEYGATPK